MPRPPAEGTPSGHGRLLPTGDMAEAAQSNDGSAERSAWMRARLRLLLIAFALASGAFLAWQTAGTLLMIFGGLLLAALLDAATRGLQHLLPLGRGACFAIVCTLSAGVILMGIAWGGYTI